MIKASFILSLFLSAIAQAETVYMAGDSTMATKRESAYPETGWGVPFADFFDDSVSVDNRARNGRSTRTFIEEGRWKAIEKVLEPGDLVIIQFGHNDDVKSKKSYTEPEQYKTNLKRFIHATRAAGASPLLMTPVVRRHFDESGQLKQTHAYLQLVRELAAKEQVDFIDMEVVTRAYFQRLGDEQSTLRYLHLPPDSHPNYPKGVRDDTHFNRQGAWEVASLVVRELKKMNHPLAKKLRREGPKHLTFNGQ